ncbi:MAG: DUF502 domain-containing protein [Verrucomicrobia bacterium]|nr:DUF502 domain-containing protein [Verrucomicrobiota bacterium]
MHVANHNSLTAHLRKTLLTGVVLLVPLVVTAKVLQILFHFTDGLLGPILSRILGKPVPGLGLLLFLIGIYLVGLTCRTFVGKLVLKWIESLIGRIPLARTIYSGVKQLLGPFGDGSGRTFGKAVMVEYPAPGIYTYGFLVKEHLRDSKGNELVNVFISSNHLHLGAVIVVDRRLVIDLNMTFEDMIKLMASCGAAAPHIERLPTNYPSPALVPVDDP